MAWRPLLLAWDAIFGPKPHGDVASNPLYPRWRGGPSEQGPSGSGRVFVIGSLMVCLDSVGSANRPRWRDAYLAAEW